MFFKFKNNKKGFTLIEAIVYMALFAVVFTTIVEFAITVGQYNGDSGLKITIDRASIFINQHINESFKNSQSINVANSTFDNDNGVLVLNSTAGNITYRLNNNRLIVNKNGADYYLSGSDLQIIKLYFEQVKVSHSNKVVGVRLTLQLRTVKKSSVSRTITTSFIYN